ncbi:hypothetical protein AWB82_03619 [Caballeronia glebae]|uniref:Uncharacterized protein n=1 Tax=Caballeronia glebae TaxID=1777143 RepID=A0A158B7H6_9BURK|nr:hypothetical protein AWB82_03619 [Caballeronia glebae]
MEQRGDGSSLYFVICPRCETLSSVEESVCPFCGADRHGAVLTRGAETALRAVEAARGVTRNIHERGELVPVRWPARVRDYEPRLPAPASQASSAAVLETERASNSILATVVMGAAVLVACFLARAYFDQQGSTPRAGTLPVAVAGTVSPAPTKTDVTLSNIDSADRIVDGASRSAPHPSVESASPFIPVKASSKENARQRVVPERSIEKKNSTSSSRQTLRTTSKTTSKTASKTASVPASKPVSKSAAACPHKSDRACAEAKKSYASKTEPKQRQTRAASHTAPVAQTKAGAKEFQKVAAIAPPVKPAMTADDSWRPSKKKN